MECFKVSGLTFRYPGEKKNALEDIFFTVDAGEFITICGLSGCGKSTLLRQLKTCLRPHGERKGTVIFEGRELDETDHEFQTHKIGFVMQSSEHQTITDKVWHELAFGLESLGMSNDVIRRRTAETAAFFGIEHLFEKNISELSGGQRKLLDLASVMVMEPSVVILDEPSSQLDPIAAGEFLMMLRKVNSDLGTTVILSEHTLDDVFSMSDRIIVMSEGRIISDDTPAQTSRKIYESGDPVFYSLPSPTRVYELMDGKSGNVPVSTGQGREWLRSYVSDKELSVPYEEEKKYDKHREALRLKGIHFRYGKEMPDVLKGIDLYAMRGEFLVITGGNGAGKTTILSVISGLLRPQRGSVSIRGVRKSSIIPSMEGISVLPQDPKALFVRSTVEEDLYEIFEGSGVPEPERKKRVKKVTELCSLGQLLRRHPYDLSGGEQQRAALAKVMLTQPEILLLDEPTKGLDARFRKKLARIIKSLTEDDVCVIAVSHDLEFCAEYADRCVMIFNGEAIGSSSPGKFFTGNAIYTTSVSRMTRGIINGAATVNTLLECLGAEKEDDFLGTDEDDSGDMQNNAPSIDETPGKADTDDTSDIPGSNNEAAEKSHGKKKFSVSKVIKGFIGILISAVFIISMLAASGIVRTSFFENNLITFGTMFVSGVLLMAFWGKGSEIIRIVRNKGSVKREMISAAIMFIAVPSTVLFGVYYFDDTKYLFISLLIMIESMVPFAIMFEKRKIQARELVLIAVLCSICTCGRAALYMLPEFKPVTALVIICAAAFGSETGFLTGAVSMLASNIFFGQGIWTPWQMFTMGLIGFLAGKLFGSGRITCTRTTLAIFGFISAFVIYGGIMNPASLIMSRSQITLSSIISCYTFGLPVDSVHAISTAVFLYIGSGPMISKLERVKTKYGLTDVSRQILRNSTSA